MFHWLNQPQLMNQIRSIIIVIYSFGMSHEFRILVKPHGISQERYQSLRRKLKTRKFLCIRRDAHFLKSCVLSKYYAYIMQDARQNESLIYILVGKILRTIEPVKFKSRWTFPDILQMQVYESYLPSK